MSGIGATLAVMMMLFQGIDDTGTAVARPIGEVHLNETSGSYFQVFEFYGKPPHTWRHAKRMVRGYLYEGREGQLATIKDVETHYFLLLNFPMMRTSAMWIGLSATCNETADLAWVDGAKLADQSFRGFGDGALRDISRTCRSRKDSGMEIPIFYEPDAFGVRWQKGTDRQNLTYMMVEFPKPADAASEEAEQE
ncbi:C-type lectin domain-containing protein [Kordiimonas lipolytica]|uniref:C-type lectin domain-containing protein n=1 Tax=Kordiimonas lipolytica TaxID=1662421 RepID=A0ABV8UGI4_9PROT|nr:C-type lectin domain-containing protein [Kordiimonas lipolytica]